jgi:hypothetical protein
LGNRARSNGCRHTLREPHYVPCFRRPQAVALIAFTPAMYVGPCPMASPARHCGPCLNLVGRVWARGWVAVPKKYCAPHAGVRKLSKLPGEWLGTLLRYGARGNGCRHPMSELHRGPCFWRPQLLEFLFTPCDVWWTLPYVPRRPLKKVCSSASCSCLVSRAAHVLAAEVVGRPRRPLKKVSSPACRSGVVSRDACGLPAEVAGLPAAL